MLVRILSGPQLAFRKSMGGFPSRLGFKLFVGIVLIGVFNCNESLAGETSDRRVQISLSIFPRIVALDNNFNSKLSNDGVATLAFVYRNNNEVAKDLVTLTSKRIASLAGRKLLTVAMQLEMQLDAISHKPTALFVSEPLGDIEFQLLLDYAVTHHVLLFSPFLGDVERGATVGIVITSRVRPYFNMNTLTKSSIEINATLIKMSKHYEKPH